MPRSVGTNDPVEEHEYRVNSLREIAEEMERLSEVAHDLSHASARELLKIPRDSFRVMKLRLGLIRHHLIGN